MNGLRVLRALGPIDARSVQRDPLLGWLLVYPLVIALAVRLGMPLVTDWALARWQIDLAPFFPLIASFVLLMPPMLTGMVVGFLLLDERDDRTLSALQVTPLTLGQYLRYRLGMPMLASTVVTLAVIPLLGLVDLGPVQVVLAALAAAPIAVLYALALAAFAQNKVQGFALVKAMGVLTLPPLLAWFVAPPWQWLFGLDPLFWPAKLLWMMVADDAGGALLSTLAAGLAYQVLLIRLLLRRFHQAMRR